MQQGELRTRLIVMQYTVQANSQYNEYKPFNGEEMASKDTTMSETVWCFGIGNSNGKIPPHNYVRTYWSSMKLKSACSKAK